MEKFTVDLDKVLDDFELQEDQEEGNSFQANISNVSSLQKNEISVIETFPEKEEKLVQFIQPLFDSTNPVVGSYESQALNGSQDVPEHHLLVDVVNTTEILKKEQQNLTIVTLPTQKHSKEREQSGNELSLSEGKFSPPVETNSSLESSSLEPQEEIELEVPVNSNSVDTQPQTLDQTLDENSLSQPQLSELIHTNILQSANMPALTEAELESYLAELEKEDFLSTSEDHLNSLNFSSGFEVSSATPMALEKSTVDNPENSDTGLSLDLPEGIDIENGDVQEPKLFDSTLSGDESDFSDSSSEDSGSDSDDSDDDVPNLLDDPTLNCYPPPQAVCNTLTESIETNSREVIEEPATSNQATEASEKETPNIPQPSNEISGEGKIILNVITENSATTPSEPTAVTFDATTVINPSTDESNNPLTDDVQGATALEVEPYSSLTDEERLLGILKPVWIPDEEAPVCMNCSQRFTVIRRRHHCRACGKVLCSACCSCKASLEYMEGKEARVCLSCLQVLKKIEAYKKWGKLDENADASLSNETANTPAASSPSSELLPQPISRVNPNNPAEYCSTIPPAVQAASAASLPIPAVMVPVGVLKKEGSSSTNTKTKSEPKQVIFSDGIRPGGDLTELDAWRAPASENPAGSHRVSSRRSKPTPPVPSTAVPSSSGMKSRLNKIAPELPPVLNGPASLDQLKVHLADLSSDPVVFAMQPSQPNDGSSPHLLTVSVKLVQLDCCIRRTCWLFTTNGMRWVAQDEIIILLERDTNATGLPELLPPADIFYHLLSIYEEGKFKHHVLVNLGHSVTTGNFLGSSEHGGFLFFRTTFQCVQQLNLPPPPYLVGVLLQRWEIPWAKVFPLRLLLRLGAEFRYYPCPLFSVRKRKPVFGEVGHTIINLLADMRNFSYSLPAVTGLVVHMEEHLTSVLLPKARYHQVCKALAQSNDHVISLAASFSPQADAHLVCLQADDGSYQTQAINIHTRPRKVTGASFLVLNGALKSSSGLTGRSSIVEDGVMVQLLPDKLEALKQALIKMEDFNIQCGKAASENPEEIVTIKWIEQEPSLVNSGVVSPIDGRNLSGISSIRVMQPRDYKGEGQRLLRWTELFILQMDDRQLSSVKADENSDITRFAEGVAKATCVALATKLAALDPSTLIGLRISSFGDSAEYQAGANFKSLPTQCCEELDSSLIPILHRETSGSTMPCVLELWFQIFHP